MMMKGEGKCAACGQGMEGVSTPQSGFSTQPTQPTQHAPAQTQGSEVEQVVKLLMEGVSPEELLSQGIPIDLIEEAIELIMASEGGA